MGWSYLLVAIALEIAWASTLKWTDGYTRPGPSLVNLVLCLANIFFLSQAIKILPTALAYSIWTGLGAVGVAIAAITTSRRTPRATTAVAAASQTVRSMVPRVPRR